MNRVGKQQGIGIIKTIALTPLILIGLVILAFIFKENNGVKSLIYDSGADSFFFFAVKNQRGVRVIILTMKRKQSIILA
ncbi:MAG: hypothetical protein KUG81_07850 [Gammaproteobacteria bacterium]|nr:hypothetical protein [Gammaproteobacteria bacterium]